MFHTSFAGVISLENNDHGIKQLPSIPNYSELSEWRIDHCTETKVFWGDLKTFIIGCVNPSSALSITDKFTTTTTTNNEDCNDNELIQCIMVMGASTPTIYNLEITNGHLDDDGELSFKWKDVKHLACTREYLFIATVDNRVFGIDIKLNNSGNSDKNFHFGKKNYPKIGKLMITCETLGKRIESAFFQVDDLRDLRIECMAANELTLFVILSNGKLYSLGYNFDGGAARGQKNVHGVDFGECEVKLKRNSKKPKFIKVIGSGRKVAALTDSGSIYLCGLRVLSLMGLDPNHNLYMFKELEWKSENYYFTDVEFCVEGKTQQYIFSDDVESRNAEGITAMTRDDYGLHIRRHSKTLYVKDEQKKDQESEEEDDDESEEEYDEEDEESEEEYDEDDDESEEDNNEEDEESDEEDEIILQNSGEIASRRLIKCLYHSNCGILIYNDHSVEIRRLGNVYEFNFYRPSSYPNFNGPIYELNCSWLDESKNFNAFFYWKFNKENYLNARRYFKRIKSYSDNQFLADVIIKCLID